MVDIDLFFREVDLKLSLTEEHLSICLLSVVCSLSFICSRILLNYLLLGKFEIYLFLLMEHFNGLPFFFG